MCRNRSLPSRRAPCSGMCWLTSWRISCEAICGRTGCFFWRGQFHWFNPVAWWTIREMQAEREAACDELAFAALGETDRSAYASSIVDLATNVAPSGMAPAMIGVISSIRRLTSRVERLERYRSVTSLRAPLIGGIVLVIALMGLTDAMPAATRIQAVGEVHDGPGGKREARRQDRHDSWTLRGSSRQFGAGRRDRAVIQGRRTDRAHRRDCENNQRRRRSI